MRVLWLSMNSGMFHLYRDGRSYNGGGWISSLQRLLITDERIQLALAFLSDRQMGCSEECGVKYYPVFSPQKSRIKKLAYYYWQYKKIDDNIYVSQLKDIIDDFHPDVIQLFGMENPFASILGKTEVPIIVHLQGLLSPYDNAYFPVGMNKYSFLRPLTTSEWILKNGFIFNQKFIHLRGEREKSLFKRVRNVMGRTKWDCHVAKFLSPDVNYYHVDEVLRDIFYEKAGQWLPHDGKLKIISTISETIYKGLDLILKTAYLLKTETNLDFEWNVVGIGNASKMQHFIERSVKIKSSDVNVSYIGVCDESSLCNQLLSSDVYVHPSYIDNSPNSLCEAQMLGMPVISTNVGGVSSLVDDGVNGLLVPANAPYELAYQIKILGSDKSLQKSLSEKGGMEAIKRHNKEKIINCLFHAYKNVVRH